MKDETLEIIGRSHTVEKIREAFDMAKKAGDFIINADLIAGLPDEMPEDFENTIREVISLEPANITVHTLAVKRASKLVEDDENYHYKHAERVKSMLKIAEEEMTKNGYKPYYLYRQKHMAGAMENVGYCKGDTPCIYNIRIMDEQQSILALGAGGISKKYYPLENRLERVPNVSNYQVYIDRLDEMIDRKKNSFFEEV
jgi:oxygen-independent coproporphyrinogen-3 oxidase